MPIYIDPVWEYYVPNPEVLGLGYRRMSAFRALIDDRVEKSGTNRGLRFGRGNPNAWPKLHYGRSKRTGHEEKDRTGWVYCKTCGEAFEQDRCSRKYCSDKCRPHLGRMRELPDINCGCCGTMFRPKTTKQQFCSMTCSASQHTGPDGPADSVLEQFAMMYDTGVAMKQIAAELGVSLPTLKRWRRRLSLPPRPSGNHSLKGGKG